MPEGWGEVTPDPYWLMQCGWCVEGQNAPEPTQEPTPTFLPGTPTPDPNQYFLVQAPEGTWPYYQDFSIGVRGYNQNITHSWDSWSLSCGPDALIKGVYGYSENIINGSYVDYIGVTGGGGYRKTGTLEIRKYWDCNQYLTVTNTLLQQAGKAPLEFCDNMADKVTVAIDSGAYEYTWNPTGIWAVWSSTYDAWFQVGGYLCYGVPEVQEPEPINSYCASVNGAGGSGDIESEEGMMLPQILVTSPTCTTVLGWDLDVSVLNLIPGIDDMQTVSLPGFQLCASYISFGTVYLFGMGVDLDVIAFLGAGIAIIRILLRS